MKPSSLLCTLLATGLSSACGSPARVASSSGGDAGPLASPPPPGPMHPPDGTLPRTFAITKLFLGDTDPDGAPDPTSGYPDGDSSKPSVQSATPLHRWSPRRHVIWPGAAGDVHIACVLHAVQPRSSARSLPR